MEGCTRTANFPVSQQEQRSIFHEALCEMLRKMYPEEVAHHMDALLYGYELGKKEVKSSQTPKRSIER